MALTINQTLRAVEYIKTKLLAKEDVNAFAIVGHVNKHNTPLELYINRSDVHLLITELLKYRGLIPIFFVYEKYNTLFVTEQVQSKLIPIAPSEEINDFKSGKSSLVQMSKKEVDAHISKYVHGLSNKSPTETHAKKFVNESILFDKKIVSIVKRESEFDINHVLSKIQGITQNSLPIDKPHQKMDSLDSALQKLITIVPKHLHSEVSLKKKDIVIQHIQLVSEFVALGNNAIEFKDFYDAVKNVKQNWNNNKHSLVDAAITKLGRRKFRLKKAFVQKFISNYTF